MEYAKVIKQFFLAIKEDNLTEVAKLIKKYPTLVNETLPYDIIPDIFPWTQADFYCEEQPEYIKEAIQHYLKTSSLDLCLQTDSENSFDIFTCLLEHFAPIGESDYLRAIAKANNVSNPNGGWLRALLSSDENDIPFSAIAYSLKNYEMDAFNILREYNKNIIYKTTQKEYYDNIHAVGLLSSSRTLSQTKTLLDAGVIINSGDIFERLCDICIDLEIFQLLLKVFITEYSKSSVILKIFDVCDGRLQINTNCQKSIELLSWNQMDRRDWCNDVYKCIEGVLEGYIISLQVLSFSVAKTHATEEDLQLFSFF